MRLWIFYKHISKIIEITACRETPPEIRRCLEQNGAQFGQVRWKMFIVIFIFCINENSN
jgi:hypothetical protein